MPGFRGLKNLKELTLCNCKFVQLETKQYIPDGEGKDWFNPLLDGCAQLESMTLCNISNYSFKPVILDVPGSHIKKLKMITCSMKGGFQLVSAPKLESLEFINFTSDSEYPISIMSAPSLKKLKLGFSVHEIYPARYTYVLDKLAMEAPRLEFLGLYFNVEWVSI